MDGNTTAPDGDRERTVRPFVLVVALAVTTLPLPGARLRSALVEVVAPVVTASPSTPAVSRAYALAGTTATPEGTVIVGATVRAILTRGGRTYPLATSQTDAGGRYRLAPLPAGDYWVVATAPGRARTLRTLRVPEAASEVALVMEPGVAITGVLSELRRGETSPLGGVVVRATREGTTPAEDPGVAARTDAEGRFTLDGVTPGSWRVEVEGSGFETLRRVGVAAPSEGLALTVRSMATLEGQVVDAHGEPARGATVTLSGSGVWPPRSFAVLDDGRFRVAELPGGVYELRASRDDDLAEPVAPLLLEPGESREQRMELRAGATLSGLVLDAQTTRPIEGARVVVTEDALSMAPRAVTTDASGRWRVAGLLRRSHQVAVRAAGYASRTGLRAEPGGEATELRLDRSARVEGRVVDARGRPVHRARVDVSVLDLDGRVTVLSGASVAFRDALFDAQQRGPQPLRPAGELGVVPGRVPIVPIEPTMQGLEVDEAAVGFVTDADGRFVVEDVPPGVVRVAASHPMYVRAEAEGREVRPGETMTVELALREGGTLEGRAVTERGFPLRALALEVRVGNEPAPRRMFTQPDGTFTLAAVQGRVSVVALMGARPVARSEVEVADGATVRLTLTVNGALRRVEGRVVDRRGFPVAGASVHMTAVERGEMGTASSVTSADGTFDTLIAGTRAVSFDVRHGDYAPRALRVDDVSRPVRIELSEGAELTMELRDDGCVTSPARVELRTTCGPVTVTATDRDVVVPHLCAGRAPMVVDAEGCVRASRTVTIPAQGRVQVGRVEIVGGGGVEGTVVDSRRKPVAG